MRSFVIAIHAPNALGPQGLEGDCLHMFMRLREDANTAINPGVTEHGY
jgi:hypothetical protein